ncbi:MAG: hypothetical protein ACKO9V_00375, partial [Candidatus Kapaibacterium sp.]
AMLATPSVVSAPDIHVWHIGADTHALSAHVVVDSDRSSDAVLHELRETLRARFALTHTTVQVETRAFHDRHACHACDGEHDADPSDHHHHDITKRP